jgi:hypothetical protein
MTRVRAACALRCRKNSEHRYSTSVGRIGLIPVGFATAAPGWRLWIVGEDGKPEEVALVGWVILAETVITTDEQGRMLEARKTGSQVIKPGWFRGRKVITTLDWGFRMGSGEFEMGEVIDTDPDSPYYDAWPVGPGDRVPTAEELADWGATHLRLAASRALSGSASSP